MAVDDDKLPLGGFIDGRIKPDAQDLMAIRARTAELEKRQAELSASSLKRLANRNEIARNKAELAQLGTAEIVAREHVRDNPHQSRNLELFERQARDCAVEENRIEAARRLAAKQPAGFDREAWRQKRAASRGRHKGGLADGDD